MRLLALKKVTVEIMQLELTKLTSALIDDDSGPLLYTGDFKNVLKPNANTGPCPVDISQLKKVASLLVHMKTALFTQVRFVLDNCCNCPIVKSIFYLNNIKVYTDYSPDDEETKVVTIARYNFSITYSNQNKLLKI